MSRLEILNLGGFSVSAVSTWQRWTSNQIVISGITGPVIIDARLSGWVGSTSTAGRRLGMIRLGISVNNGSSYTLGNQVQAELDRSGADIRAVPVSCDHSRQVASTGTIAVQVEVRQHVLGAAGDLVWDGGRLTVRVTRPV